MRVKLIIFLKDNRLVDYNNDLIFLDNNGIVFI